MSLHGCLTTNRVGSFPDAAREAFYAKLVWVRIGLLVATLGTVSFAHHPSAYADSKSDARRAFNEGMRAIEAGRVREGIRLLEDAYETLPHPSVLFNMGRAYATLGDLGRSIEYFERYRSSEPEDAAEVDGILTSLRLRRRLRGLVRRGLEAVRRERYVEGIGYLRQAYRLRPNPAVMYNIGRAYEDSGQIEQALESFETYLRSDPSDAKAVQSRIARLQRRRERSSSLAADASSKRPPSPSRSERGPPRGRSRPRNPRPPPETVPSEPQPELSNEQVEALADAVYERLRDLPGITEAPPPRPGQGSDPSVTADDAEAGQPLEATPLPPSPLKPVDVAQEGDRPASDDEVEALAADPEALEALSLEAKGGAAYADVVVTASRRPQSPLEAPNAVTIITSEDIRLSGARTVPDLLRRVPGMDVMAMSYTDYNVAARGFNRRLANKLLVLVDGQTAYLDFLGFTSWRTLPVELLDIDRIEVVRGPGSAVYGAYAYTGIVNIITKRPREVDGATVQLSAGNGEVAEGSFQYGQRTGNIGVRLSGGYQRGEKYEIDFDATRPDVSSELEDPAESLELGRFNGLLEYYLPTENPSFVYLGGSFVEAQHEFFGIADQRNFETSGPEVQFRAGYESELFTLRSLFHRFSKDTQSQSFTTGLTLLSSRTVSDIFSVEPIFQPEFELAGKHRLVIGGEYRFKSIEWDVLRGDRTEDHFAFYFQDEWRFDPSFLAIVSARLDIHPLIGPLGSPRVAFIYRPDSGQAIRISLGTAFRVPTMAETYLSLSGEVPDAPGTAVTLVGGGDDLEAENIATIDIGYRVESDVGEFEVVGYFNRVSNLIVRSPLVPTGLDARFLEEIGALEVGRSVYGNEDDDYLAFGAELDGHLFFIEGLDVGATYSFQYIVNEDTGDRFTDSPLHKVSAWSQLRTRMGLDLGLSVHFVSDQAWIEAEFDTESPTGFDETPLPLDPTVTALARVGYRMFDEQLELAVSGVNLFDVGDNRRRQHPFGNRLEARVLGSVTGRF